jgi:hypothetical protein
LIAWSNIPCSGSVSLRSESCRIGTSEALYWITSGGWCPGGIARIAVWAIAVTWAIAVSILAFGWK